MIIDIDDGRLCIIMNECLYMHIHNKQAFLHYLD